MSPPDTEIDVHHITAVNDWALDVGLEARLDVHQAGYLAPAQHAAARRRTSTTGLL